MDSLEQRRKQLQIKYGLDKSESKSTPSAVNPVNGETGYAALRKKYGLSQTSSATPSTQSSKRYVDNILDEIFSRQPTVSKQNTAIELPSVDTGYDPVKNRVEGQAGWNAYLEHNKQRTQNAAQAEEKPLWERLLGYLGDVGPDTSMPFSADTNQIAEGYQEQEREKQKPDDRWTEEQQYTFGYLWNTERQKAWEYAYAVNNMLNEQEEEAKRNQIKQDATKNFGAGAAHTVGAVLTSPIGGLAESLGDLIAYGALGYLPGSDGETSLHEYSEAVKGGISSHLNKKGGTISEAFPIIGGKGWGDVYSLGTSIAQSLLSAQTGGGGQALITSFGSAVASGIDDAKARGATDSKAIGYGVLTGVAEAFAEMIGVDNLMKIGAADSMKAVLKNILKQGAAEGLEEGITSILNNFADNLVLQDKSKLNIAISDYMEKGMTREEAQKKAWMDMAGDVAFDMLGGFVSGNVSGGIQTGIQTAAEKMSAAPGSLEWVQDIGGPSASDKSTNADATSTATKVGKDTDQSRRLTDEDIADYMRVGERRHVRDTKQRIIDNGESPILTKPEEIINFIRNAFQRKIQKVVKGYGRVNNRLASAVKTATNGNINIQDYYLELDADKIAHISDHIGQDKDIRNIPLTEEQLEQLPEYIDTYDDLIDIIQRKDGSVRLMLGKKINGHSIILETVSKGRKSLHPVTAYQIDSADYVKHYKTRAIDRSSTSRPANTDTVDISRPTIALNNSISQTVPGVNTNSEQTAEPSIYDKVMETIALGQGKDAAQTVDTESQAGYDIKNNQGGIANANTQGRYIHSGGDGRNTQSNSQRKTSRSAENGRRNVQSSHEIRLYGGDGKGTLYASDSEGRELTPDQTAKLQGTAVTDSNGVPLAVYHVTDNTEFTAFAKGDTGFHFGSAEQAARHGKKRGYTTGRTFRVYLNIKNPIRTSKDIMGWHPGGTALLLWDDGVLTESEKQEVTAMYRIGDGYDSAAAIRLREILESKGYDGIAYPNGFEGDGMSYIAFRNDQIVKSEITPFGTEGADINTNPSKSAEVENTADNTAVANPSESVGAADQNFTGRAAYQDLLTDENSQRDRPGDVRPVEVPKVDGYGRNVSEFVGNAYGSEVVPDDFTAIIEELVQEGALGYDTKTNAESLHEAAEVIKKKGMASARNAITKNIANGKIGDTDIATAMLLFNRYAHKNGQQAQDSAAELFVDLQMMATQTGRDLQLFKMLRKMTPQGQLMAVTKNVDRYVQNINKRRGRKNQVEVSVPNELTNEYMEAAQDAAVNDTPENQQRKLDAEQAIYEYAAANIPATLQEKWDAWRYLAMLGNPKTQIRNVMGNGLFRPFVEAKRYLGTAIEPVFLEQEQRTKSVLGFSANDRALLNWARQDSRTADTMQQMEYTATTGDAAVSEIGDRRQIFKTTALEKARTGLNDIMSAEDMWFKRGAYSTALASFLKARGVTAQQLQDGSVDSTTLNAARNYAVKEAMKATFNDQNAVSNFVANKLRYKGNNKFGKILNAAAEGILPFRRTPANIALRGLEYSPLGLGKTLLADTGKLRNGEITAAEYIDNIAAGLTGSAAMALGYALASGIFEGIRLVGNEDDEDEKRTGHKSYALEVGNVSIPVDWAAPAVLPLFMGANLYDSLNPEIENVSTSVFASILDAGANTLEPMLELSCLSSLNDLITDARYAEQGRELYTIAASAATSYFMQGLPTLFGQVEQAFETEKKSVYADSSDPVISEVQQLLGRATQKIPGIDLYQTEKVDAWGRTEEKGAAERIFDAFINPANDSRIVETKADSEIKWLNRVQDKDVSPDTPAKTLTFTGKDGKAYTDRRLTGAEYEELAKLQGQTQKQIVEDLLANSYYDQLSDEDKAKAIRYAYDYARDSARGEVIEEHPGITTKWMQNIGDDPAEGIIRHITADDNYTSLSVSDASYVDKLLADLLPEKGKTKVRTIQQVEAIAGSKLPEKDQKAALEDTLDDKAYAKYLRILALGVDTDDYAETYRIYLDEKDIGGKGTKARIIAQFQDELDVSKGVAEKLYDIYCGAK